MTSQPELSGNVIVSQYYRPNSGRNVDIKVSQKTLTSRYIKIADHLSVILKNPKRSCSSYITTGPYRTGCVSQELNQRLKDTQTQTERQRCRNMNTSHP